ncbi:general stress protein [Curtobacterium sp. RRHDQ10]|uniref:general stress protein n=1 Tax=Curtobacterium phyllosphaerae TaxID=3413379 RepID=UPI003BF1FD2D
MSTQSPFGRTNAAFPSLPRGDVLGTYETYPEAQRVVAKLAESDFPVGQLSIVGNDLKTVERVTGKLTYGRAAIAGAVSGLWLGLFFGIVLTLFSRGTSGVTIFAAAVIGAAFGMLYGVVSFSITKRQRDFTSVHQVLATNYQIVVDPQLSGRAQQILGTASAGWTPQHQQAQHTQPWAPPAQPQEPPQARAPQQQYGEMRGAQDQRHDQPPYGQQVPADGRREPQAPARPVAQPERPRYGENAPVEPAVERPAPERPTPERSDEPNRTDDAGPSRD